MKCRSLTLLVFVGLAAGCSGATNPTPSNGATNPTSSNGATSTISGVGSAAVSAGPISNAAPDTPVAGAQGRVPQFLVECPYSHSGADDPIVFPGQPGASHMHVFFGNDTANASSTYESLLAGRSQCDQQLDTASYWAPALLDRGTVLTPVKSVAYYRPGEGIDPTSVKPYPPGLKIVAGNAAAFEPQSSGVVAWTCGTGVARDTTPPACPSARPLRMLVTFPDCWDGVNVDSADHHSHMAYSSRGACPASHPVAVPQLQFSVVYRFSGDPGGLSLASGPLTTGHADFFNAWNQDKLTSEIILCIHRLVICGVTSGRK